MEIKNLAEVLNNLELLKKFRFFLRGHLALENLLFFESILLYEKTTCRCKRREAGEFMLNQFVKAEGEDAANISARTREELEGLEAFEKDSFSKAKHELYRLMDSNFLASFIKYLNGADEKLIENFDSLSSSYFQDLSYESVEELLEEDEDGRVHFLDCFCNEDKEEGKLVKKKSSGLLKMLTNLKENHLHFPRIRKTSIVGSGSRPCSRQRKRKPSLLKPCRKARSPSSACVKDL